MPQQLQSERLLLRSFEKGDLSAFYQYARKPEVGPSAGWKPHDSIAETQQILNRFIEEDIVWAIIYRPDRRLAGSVGLHRDPKRGDVPARMLGYALDSAYWGRGIAAEASRMVIRYAFETTDLAVISAYHYLGNERSRRVIEKCGMTYEGVLRLGDRLYDGRLPDEALYSLTRAEYERMAGRV